MLVIKWVSVVLGLIAAGGTLISFSRNPHSLVRIWDFPRVQISVAAALSGGAYALLFFRGGWLEWAFLAAVGLCLAYQLAKIFPYTPVAPKRVERSRGAVPGSTFRLLISNVLMENEHHERVLERIRECDPDLVLTVEINERWARALEPLSEKYPYVVRHPQENYYGLMLFSRLPLIEPEVKFLVQEDVPSVHTEFELPSGARVFLHGLHPRPPEPIRDQDSTPRDAELVVMGKAIGETEDRPTIVAGDLNDVAWSRSSELFLRLSGLLDPRMGRGFFNSYNANNPFFRYPLDHIFHSAHFRLIDIRRLRHVGSDHFPVLIELSCEPGAPKEQPRMHARPEDEEAAHEKLEEQAEAAVTGDDRPGRE